MNKKTFVLAALATTLVVSSARPDDRPNILVVMTDDMMQAELPELSRLREKAAKDGVVFPNSFCNFCLCGPSRTTFLTGQAAHNHGVVSNTGSRGGWDNFTDRDNNIGNWMQNAGYRTGMIGVKLINGWDGKGVLKGWDTFKVGYKRQGGDKNKNDCWAQNENGTSVEYCDPGKIHNDDVWTDQSINFIKKVDNRPWFLWVMPKAPHGPHDPAARYLGTYKNWKLPKGPAFNEADVSDKPFFIRSEPRFSASEIRDMENEFGERLEQLQSVDDMMDKFFKTIPDNTLVIFTSDNGYSRGDHRWDGKGLIYESISRVPLIIWHKRLNKIEAAPGRRSHLVSSPDIPATIVDYGNATPRRKLDGRSLRSILRNPEHSAWRSAVALEGRFKADPTPSGIGLSSSIRTHRFVLTDHNVKDRPKEPEFYDLETDPYQLRNGIGVRSNQSRIRELYPILDQLSTCAGETCWVGRNVVK